MFEHVVSKTFSNVSLYLYTWEQFREQNRLFYVHISVKYACKNDEKDSWSITQMHVSCNYAKIQILVMISHFWNKGGKKQTQIHTGIPWSKVSHSISLNMCAVHVYLLEKTFFENMIHCKIPPQEPKKFRRKLSTWKQSQCFVEDCFKWYKKANIIYSIVYTVYIKNYRLPRAHQDFA